MPGNCSKLFILTHLIFITILGSKYYYSYFIEEETEANFWQKLCQIFLQEEAYCQLKVNTAGKQLPQLLMFVNCLRLYAALGDKECEMGPPLYHFSSYGPSPKQLSNQLRDPAITQVVVISQSI